MRMSSFAALLALLLSVAQAPLAADEEFPFEHELYLDIAPMAGSKRVPGLEVAPDGRATIDLWCASGPGQVVIAANTITIIPGALTPTGGPECAPERAQADADMLRALTEVTTWRRQDDVVLLEGPRPLRFYVSTH